MPSRKTTRAAKANAARMPSIPRELLDQIEKQGPMTAETIQQASMAFKKALNLQVSLRNPRLHDTGLPNKEQIVSSRTHSRK